MKTNFQAPSYMELLPVSILSRLSRAKLHARGYVAGFRSGDHRSPYIGTSTEFAEHREYCPGDDPRHLDWHVYGKMDRYYIKQYVEETNLRATILLDASASMKFTGTDAAKMAGKPLSKFSYATHLAATLAYLLTQQGDAVGLICFDSQIRKKLPALSTPAHLRSILETLYTMPFGGESKLASVFHESAEQIPKRSLVFLISDFFDDVPDVIRAWHHFRFRKQELVILHVMANEEFDLSVDSSSCFRDLEHSGSLMDLDPRSIRGEYLRRIGDFLRNLERGCGQVEASYTRFNTRISYEDALTDFLAGSMKS